MFVFKQWVCKIIDIFEWKFVDFGVPQKVKYPYEFLYGRQMFVTESSSNMHGGRYFGT